VASTQIAVIFVAWFITWDGIGAHSDTLHLDWPPRHAHEAVAERQSFRIGDLNLAQQPVRLEPRGQIHRLALHVIREFVRADHSRHDRAARDANADLEVDAMGN
jgi:hypothetical protein